MNMSSLKKFVGDYAYSYIKNIAVDQDKLRHALVTPQNARNVFSELDEFQIKSICAEISANDTFGTIRETTQEEIIEDFKKAGYDTVIFDKDDKRKKEVDAISYEADLKEIKEMFSKLKAKLVLKLNEANTYEEYSRLENVFDYYFVWMVRDIENLEKKVTQNKFNIIKEATDSIASLKEKLQKIMRKMEGEEVD